MRARRRVPVEELRVIHQGCRCTCGTTPQDQARSKTARMLDTCVNRYAGRHSDHRPAIASVQPSILIIISINIMITIIIIITININGTQ
eukprot:7714529-Pyramimonas_sp.AAC.1